MCFVDFKKAFDSIPHETLWVTMIEIGFPEYIINILTKLYSKQKARVKVAGTMSTEFRIRRGVRQGCVLSPTLFNIVAEMVIRETLEGYEGGVQIGGRLITNLRYADDIILIANTVEELQTLTRRLNEAGRKFGLQIKTSKTKGMTTAGATCQIRINEETLEQADTFMYLGLAITRDSDCATEIRIRLAKGYAVATDLERIWKSHDIKVTTKMELLRTLVWPVAIYGCEGWTMRKDEERRIEAFEMKCLRMIMQITWTEKPTNKWVLEKAGVERKLLGIVKEREMKYFGHIMRKKESCLEKEIMWRTPPERRLLECRRRLHPIAATGAV